MDRVDEINKRISNRQIGSHELEPVFDPRPNGTRGGLSNHNNSDMHLKQYSNYNPETMFNPITKTAPYKGYASRIHLENELRNQFFALQRSENGAFIPSTKSDLYEVDAPAISNETIHDAHKHEHTFLFLEENFANFNPNEDLISKDTLFNNNTKQYVKDSKIKL